MALNTTALNAGITAIIANITHAALFDGSGVELTGGSPAYARQAVTWGTVASGAAAITNQPEFNVPAGKTVATVRYYNALTDGTCYGIYDATDESYTAQGTYKISSFSIGMS